MNINTQKVAEESEQQAQRAPPHPKKIGGILYLVSFFVFVQPLFSLVQLFSFLTASTNQLKLSEDLPRLSLYLFSVVFVLTIEIILVMLFLHKDSRFPKVFVYRSLFLAVSSVFIVICTNKDFIVTSEVASKTAANNIIMGIFWALYLFNSSRVKETFVLRRHTLNFLNLRSTFLIPFLIISLSIVLNFSK